MRGFAGSGNLNTDPAFVTPEAGDYRLGQSPCRDVGSNSALPADVGDLDWDKNVTEALPLDLAGSLRKVNFTVDLGPYENTNIIE